MLGNMKPVPKFILIAVAIGAVVFGVQKSGLLDKMKAPAPVEQTVTQPQVQPQVVSPQPASEPVALPQERTFQQPVQQAPAGNAGLDAVLKQGARK